MSKLSLSVRMVLVLTLVTVMSGGILASWDIYTKPKVAYHREQALKKAITEVLPAHDSYTIRESDAGTLYIATDHTSDQVVGIAFMATGSGFQGQLGIMVGLDPDLAQLTGIKVLEQIETPGLGTKIVVDPSNKEDPTWFAAQFKGVHVDSDILVVKNAEPSTQYEVQGITGATISSKAVTAILNKKIAQVRAIMASGEGSES